MPSKDRIRLAKEIKVNFQLFLIAIVCTLVTHGILYVTLKPPVATQSEVVWDPDRDSGLMSSVKLPTEFGRSKYDFEIVHPEHLNDLNAFRKPLFEADLKEKTIIAFLLFPLALCGGRYLFLLVQWVQRTSRLE